MPSPPLSFHFLSLTLLLPLQSGKKYSSPWNWLTDGLVTQKWESTLKRQLFCFRKLCNWVIERFQRDWKQKNTRTFTDLVSTIRVIHPPSFSLSFVLQSLAWSPRCIPNILCFLVLASHRVWFAWRHYNFLAFSLNHESRNQKGGGLTGDDPSVIRFKETTGAWGCVHHQSVLAQVGSCHRCGFHIWQCLWHTARAF